MMNQPLRRLDPLGRSAPLTPERPNLPWLSAPSRGSVWPIGGGSERAIVDSPKDLAMRPVLEATLRERERER